MTQETPSEVKLPSRKTVRLYKYDYSAEGCYFITLCAQDKKCIFGHIVDREMILNTLGKLVKEELLHTSEVRPNMQIHEYVIMPNHIHFIVEILDSRGELNSPVNNNDADESNPPLHCSHTIGAMVRGFKSAITKQIRTTLNKNSSIWQRNYYEHIIRSYPSYQEIRNYILSNPERWTDDTYYK